MKRVLRFFQPKATPKKLINVYCSGMYRQIFEETGIISLLVPGGEESDFTSETYKRVMVTFDDESSQIECELVSIIRQENPSCLKDEYRESAASLTYRIVKGAVLHQNNDYKELDSYTNPYTAGLHLDLGDNKRAAFNLEILTKLLTPLPPERHMESFYELHGFRRDLHQRLLPIGKLAILEQDRRSNRPMTNADKTFLKQMERIAETIEFDPCTQLLDPLTPMIICAHCGKIVHFGSKEPMNMIKKRDFDQEEVREFACPGRCTAHTYSDGGLSICSVTIAV